MAIVASGRASTGAKWNICDDAYIRNTPEQNEALRLRACRIARDILVEHAQKINGGIEHAENCRNDHQGRRGL